MKNIIYILTFLLFIFNNANGQTLEQILEKHSEAVGMEHLENVETIKYKGSYVNHFLKNISENIPDNLLKPDFTLSVEKQKAYLLQIFDTRGERAYGYWLGKYWKDPCGFPPEEWSPNNFDRLLIQYYLALEGFLYNWKKKNHEVVKLDDIVLENKRMHRIRLTTSESDTLYYYINAKNYLISKMSIMGDLADGKEHTSFTFLKYKKVQNILIPHKRIHRTMMLDGSFGNKDIIIDKIELNLKFDEKIFRIDNRINNSKTN